MMAVYNWSNILRETHFVFATKIELNASVFKVYFNLQYKFKTEINIQID